MKLLYMKHIYNDVQFQNIIFQQPSDQIDSIDVTYLCDCLKKKISHLISHLSSNNWTIFLYSVSWDHDMKTNKLYFSTLNPKKETWNKQDRRHGILKGGIYNGGIPNLPHCFLCFNQISLNKISLRFPITWRMGSQDGRKWLGSPPFIIHGVRPFGRGPTTQSLGDNNQP